MKRISIFGLFFIVLIIPKLAFGQNLLNLLENAYNDSSVQKVNDEFYGTLKREFHKKLNSGFQFNWSDNRVCEKQENTKAQYGFAAEILEKEKVYKIDLILCDFKNTKSIRRNIEVEKYYIKKPNSINYKFFIALLLNDCPINDDNRSSRFYPFGGCDISTYSLKGGALSEYGISKRGNYYYEIIGVHLPTCFGSNNSIKALPYDVQSIKEYLLYNVIEKAMYLKEPIKNYLRQNVDKYTYAFNTLGNNRDFYISYKYQNDINDNYIKIIAEFYYSVNSTKMISLNKDSVIKYETLAALNVYKTLMKKKIDRYFYEFEPLFSGANDKVPFLIDTAAIIKQSAKEVNLQALKEIRSFKNYRNFERLFKDKVFVKKNEIYGYASGSWKLNSIQLYILDKVIDKIERLYKNQYLNSEFNILLTGYADNDSIKYRIINEHYHKNILYNSQCGKESKFVDFRDNAHNELERLPKYLKTNCQLSYLRAYDFAQKMNKRIPNVKIKYKGIGEIDTGDKYFNRKVTIKISNRIGVR